MTREVIVVGLGAMGSAATFQLAARGVRVVAFDQYAPPHPWGSSHGETRITRLAIGEGSEYVPLARRSHELWREIELESGAGGSGTGRAGQLLTQTGVVILGSSTSAFLHQTRASAREHRIAHEDLTSTELRSRFPMFVVDERTEGYYEPEGGYLRPEAAVAAQLELAGRRGAQLHVGERVLRWSASAEGVAVTTDSGRYAANQLLLCPGAWIPELFPEGRDMFAVYRQHLFWFPIRARFAQLRDMPAFIWDLGGAHEEFVHLPGFYGFPAIDGPDGGVKVAMECYEDTALPDGRQHPPTPAEIELMLTRCVRPYLRWLDRTPLKTTSCLYTSTRDSRFVIDRHPEHDSVLIVSACSGHGFKHSPAIGEAVAQWLCGARPAIDLDPFSFARAQPPGGSGPWLAQRSAPRSPAVTSARVAHSPSAPGGDASVGPSRQAQEVSDGG